MRLLSHVIPTLYFRSPTSRFLAYLRVRRVAGGARSFIAESQCCSRALISFIEWVNIRL